MPSSHAPREKWDVYVSCCTPMNYDPMFISTPKYYYILHHTQLKKTDLDLLQSNSSLPIEIRQDMQGNKPNIWTN